MSKQELKDEIRDLCKRICVEVPYCEQIIGVINKHIPDDSVVVPKQLIKAVAHIGIDFGYGKYELRQEHIETARKIIDGEFMIVAKGEGDAHNI